MLYLTISQGRDAGQLRPVIATSDARLIRAVLHELASVLVPSPRPGDDKVRKAKEVRP